MDGLYLRFITKAQYIEGVNLYHLARTALSSKLCKRYDRMQWAAKELNKKYPEVSVGGAYKDLYSNCRMW